MKRIKIVFSIIFILITAIPLIFTNLKPNVISEDENRYLTPMAKLYTEDGTLNRNYLADFESWFNDNVGFRSKFVLTNAKIQYYGFRVLSNNSDMYLGPKGELNYATPEIIKDYQHLNMWSEEDLERITDSYQIINDYLEDRNIQYYYYQCWDKHSIYPEQFPTSVIQFGQESRTDQRIQRMITDTSISVISSKQNLIDSKDLYESYSIWGDPTHWTQRGAYIGYLDLMAELNRCNNNQFIVLDEDDYEITVTDQGNTLFGGIHHENLSEKMDIKNPKAIKTNEKLTLFSEDERHDYYTNNFANNDLRVLVLGDSYFDNFLMDDLAESFHEVLIIRADYTLNLVEILDEYNPDIVINECAERVDRSHLIIELADTIREL